MCKHETHKSHDATENEKPKPTSRIAYGFVCAAAIPIKRSRNETNSTEQQEQQDEDSYRDKQSGLLIVLLTRHSISFGGRASGSVRDPSPAY